MDFIRTIVHEGKEDFYVYLLQEHLLTKSKARDTKKVTLASYRTLFHEYKWGYLNQSEQKRMKAILLKNPALSDWENWKIYLDKNLKFPFRAKSRGYLEFPMGTKIIVEGLEGYNKEVGLIVTVMYHQQLGNYPLLDI